MPRKTFKSEERERYFIFPLLISESFTLLREGGKGEGRKREGKWGRERGRERGQGCDREREGERE